MAEQILPEEVSKEVRGNVEKQLRDDVEKLKDAMEKLKDENRILTFSIARDDITLNEAVAERDNLKSKLSKTNNELEITVEERDSLKVN